MTNEKESIMKEKGAFFSLNQKFTFSITLSGVLLALWMIGTQPAIDDKPIVTWFLETHFATKEDVKLALQKQDISDYIQRYEYLLDKHIQQLEAIKNKEFNTPQAKELELKMWDAEHEKIKEKLKNWRKKQDINLNQLGRRFAAHSPPVN